MGYPSWVPFFAAKLRLCWGIWLHFAIQFALILAFLKSRLVEGELQELLPIDGESANTNALQFIKFVFFKKRKIQNSIRELVKSAVADSPLCGAVDSYFVTMLQLLYSYILSMLWPYYRDVFSMIYICFI